MEKSRAREAIKAVLQKHLDYWGPRYQTGALKVEVEGEWAHGVAEWESEEKLVDGPIHLLARRSEDGTWQALMPSEEGLYLQWVEKAPERLVSDSEKELLHLQAIESQISQHIPKSTSVVTMPTSLPEQPSNSLSPLTPSSRKPLSTSLSSATFHLDGVKLNLSTSFLSASRFITSDRDSAAQVATAVERGSIFKELSVTAIPFGMAPPTESLPRADSQSEERYRAILKDYRTEQNGNPHSGPRLNLFNEMITGSTSIVDAHIYGNTTTSIAITEWVAEAGNRIWIVRASKELEDDPARQSQSLYSTDSFSRTSLRSHNLNQPSTSLRAVQQISPTKEADTDMEIDPSSVTSSDLPSPSWWNGECDTNNYYAATGMQAYSLGAEFRGMKACGPRDADGGPDVEVNFGEGITVRKSFRLPVMSRCSSRRGCGYVGKSPPFASCPHIHQSAAMEARSG